YRIPASGEIVVSLMDRDYEKNLTDEGWESLRRYGQFDMTTAYAANHPFELLFLNGGAGEFSKQQVLENGWQINPPRLPICGQALTQYHKGHNADCWARERYVTFPQLDGTEE